MNEDFDVDAELGFEPAVSATGAAEGRSPRTKPGKAKTAKRERSHRSTLRRRIGAGIVLLAGLGSMGGIYAAFATSSGATQNTSSATQVAEGKQLYETSCITCHGANLQGVDQRGVSLVGVGGAATYFQVATGRMPATGQGAEELRKAPKFTEEQVLALAAYIQSVGGGPAVPQGSVQGGTNSIAEGGELFRLNCSSCHGTTFRGAPLSAGKVAPSLNDATAEEIYTAMLSGPESMPVFSDNQLTPSEKKAVVAYIQTIKASDDPGGEGIGRIGPVSEAVVCWVAGIGALMIAILWIGAKVS